MTDNALLRRQAALRRPTYWEDKGLLEGVDDEYERGNLVMMLENQKAWLNEAATTTSDIVPFAKFAFPLVGRVYPELLAKRLGSVRPISMPSAMVFWLVFCFRIQVDPVDRGAGLYCPGLLDVCTVDSPRADSRE